MVETVCAGWICTMRHGLQAGGFHPPVMDYPVGGFLLEEHFGLSCFSRARL
jgi:hypothetical protein